MPRPAFPCGTDRRSVSRRPAAASLCGLSRRLTRRPSDGRRSGHRPPACRAPLQDARKSCRLGEPAPRPESVPEPSPRRPSGLPGTRFRCPDGSTGMQKQRTIVRRPPVGHRLGRPPSSCQGPPSACDSLPCLSPNHSTTNCPFALPAPQAGGRSVPEAVARHRDESKSRRDPAETPPRSSPGCRRSATSRSSARKMTSAHRNPSPSSPCNVSNRQNRLPRGENVRNGAAATGRRLLLSH